MKILKWILKLVLIPYIVIAVFVTACLMCYNDYKITVFGDYSLIIIEDDDLGANFQKGDLVVVKKNSYDEVKPNSYAFFYNTYESKVSVNLGKLVNKHEVNENEATYTIEGDYSLSSEYFIGLSDTAVIYRKVGAVLSVLESRYGFLGLIVLPILVAFIYEIYAIVQEIRHPEED